MSVASPTVWPKKRLKYAVSLRRTRADGDDDERPYVGLEQIESGTGRLVPTAADGESGTHTPIAAGESFSNTFEPGDVLFGKLRPYLAKAWIAEFAGRCTTELLVMQPTEFDPRFLRYVCLSRGFIDIVDATTFGSKMPRADWEFIGNTPIPLPTLQCQRRVANFLDRETARLDALVGAKERLLGLLAEKRRALITRAVTRGLDPRAPLRDSGIPWLGEIPARWDALRLKHLLKAQKGSIKTGPFGSQLHLSEMQEGQIKVYNQKTVIDRDIAGGDDYISKQKFDELRSFEVFPGDLLVTTRGTIGRCMVVPEEAERGILHPCLMRIQLADNRALNDYIEMIIEDSGQVLDQLRIVSNATTIDVIYSESLKEVWLVVPPIPEQRAIVAHIAAETAKLDALRSATERTIGLLKERRAALIAAAVTGAIVARETGS